MWSFCWYRCSICNFKQNKNIYIYNLLRTKRYSQVCSDCATQVAVDYHPCMVHKEMSNQLLKSVSGLTTDFIFHTVFCLVRVLVQCLCFNSWRTYLLNSYMWLMQDRFKSELMLHWNHISRPAAIALCSRLCFGCGCQNTTAVWSFGWITWLYVSSIQSVFFNEVWNVICDAMGRSALLAPFGASAQKGIKQSRNFLFACICSNM